jgi:hypothetical protein
MKGFKLRGLVSMKKTLLALLSVTSQLVCMLCLLIGCATTITNKRGDKITHSYDGPVYFNGDDAYVCLNSEPYIAQVFAEYNYSTNSYVYYYNKDSADSRWESAVSSPKDKVYYKYSKYSISDIENIVSKSSAELHKAEMYKKEAERQRKLAELQKWQKEQGSLILSVSPGEIYQEDTNNVLRVTVEYNLIADEAILIIILHSGNTKQAVENKVVSRGQKSLTYNLTAKEEIKSPYQIEAYFKEQGEDRTFANSRKEITLKSRMSEPIPDARTMQIILNQVANNAAKLAESDFSRAAGYAQHLDLKTLLMSISSGQLQVIFATSYPLTISNDCNEVIEDWQYVSRQKFENAVYIQAYMETVQKLQRRSRY